MASQDMEAANIQEPKEKSLREMTCLFTNMIVKTEKGDDVSEEVLCKICKALNCWHEDVVEIAPDEVDLVSFLTKLK